ncbi:hypothetical protein D3C81_2284930 [compost metagenome]
MSHPISSLVSSNIFAFSSAPSFKASSREIPLLLKVHTPPDNNETGILLVFFKLATFKIVSFEFIKSLPIIY